MPSKRTCSHPGPPCSDRRVRMNDASRLVEQSLRRMRRVPRRACSQPLLVGSTTEDGDIEALSSITRLQLCCFNASLTGRPAACTSNGVIHQPTRTPINPQGRPSSHGPCVHRVRACPSREAHRRCAGHGVRGECPHVSNFARSVEACRSFDSSSLDSFCRLSSPRVPRSRWLSAALQSLLDKTRVRMASSSLRRGG